MFRFLGIFCLLTSSLSFLAGRGSAEDSISLLVHPAKASFAERLAAQEIRRYFYLMTGKLLPIADETTSDFTGDAIVVGEKGWKLWSDLSKYEPEAARSIEALEPQQYLIKTISRKSDNKMRKALLVVGGDSGGVMYGAYRLAEEFGVRFYLHGDVVPDAKISPAMPTLDLTGKPLFSVRGINPFHDFPEGPDWWNLDDYKAYLGQLPKLGMNFIGMHCYPECTVGPEPLVWIGLREDIVPGGQVKFAYPARHFTTNGTTGHFGYQRTPASRFAFGAAALFDRDDYGADYMRNLLPLETMPPEQCILVFRDMGGYLNEAFTYAHRLKIKTCVGTETPMIVPKKLAEHLKAAGKDPADPAVVQELYEGMFKWIKEAYPVDYYWLWTPEGWTWTPVTQEQIDATLADFSAAQKAMEKVKPPFTLATCGWVLGPPQSPALFDEHLPKNMPFSCINRTVGNTPVEPGFADVKGRPKWAIPWMEDDPGMTIPQLWAGRMRRDAADALSYGCTGLLGIHWRTEILGPNVSSLAKAAWDQSGWNKESKEDADTVADRVLGGLVAQFPDSPIADTEEAPLYQTVRYDLGGYRLKIPNGTYNVTLKFCEPAYSEKDKRVFGVKLQGQPVIEKLDVFAKVGQNKAIDFSFKDIKIADGLLKIDFVKQVEFPCIAAIAIEGTADASNQFPARSFARKINCGGPTYKDYEADISPNANSGRSRYLPVDDFYADWAKANFGPKCSEDIAKIFVRLDGHLPRPADWVTGPGSIRPDKRPWGEVAKLYAFVEELNALRPKIEGAGERARFDYWLHQFRYLRDIAQACCVWGEYETAMEKVRAEKDATAQKKLARETALPIRIRLVEAFAQMYRDLLAAASTPGEFGNVANWQMQTFPVVLNKPGEELSKIFNEPLPPEAMPSSKFTGEPRLIVPTVRTSILVGESLTVKAIPLGFEPTEMAMYYRELGDEKFSKIEPATTPETHGGYSFILGPAIENTDFEYYIEASDSKTKLRFPPTAPRRGQTVIVVKE